MNGKGAKHDKGKPQLGLLDFSFLNGIARIREYGVEKYGDSDSWKCVPDAERRYKDALLRHILAWSNGEECDEESGLPHFDHAMCNMMFLYCLKKKRII